MDRIFPNKLSLLTFISYISLFVSQGLLIKAVHRNRIDGFNSIIVILLTELAKLIISVTIYMIRAKGNIYKLTNDLKKNQRLLLLYLIPAFLYCLYNNLTFVNLELFDLTTYYCLMQFRIVVTALVYQIIFRRRLNIIQWSALSILTIGCLIKEYGMYNKLPAASGHDVVGNITSATGDNDGLQIEDYTYRPFDKLGPLLHFIALTSLLLVQLFCSCFAGVYNEYLLKDSSTANNADVVLQNIFMYVDSLFCNLIVYNIASSSERNKSTQMKGGFESAISLLGNQLVFILILNNAISGQVASLFLKSLNSILKTFASAIELFVVAILALILFDDPIDGFTIVALSLVSVSIFIYSTNPVSTEPPNRPGNIVTTRKDGFLLLPTSEKNAELEEIDH